MHIELAVTLGDLVVAGTTASTIIGAYLNMRQQLRTMNATMIELMERVDGHEEQLDDHDRAITALDTRVFGQRRTDRRKRRRGNHQTTQEDES